MIDLESAANDLAARDPAMREIVTRMGPPDLPRPVLPGAGSGRSHFAELARAICFQQLAGAAARAIHGRFVAVLGGDPTPEAVLAVSVDELRAAGLSASKAASIRDLAAKVRDGTVALEAVAVLADDEVVRELTVVRGIGRWTAEMFLIFQLGRRDVWPVDDYGVRKGYAQLYDLADLPTARALLPLGDAFRPHRSIAAWYCWRAAESR